MGSQPQEALDLVNAWGLTLKTMTGFTWVKLTRTGLPFFGVGFWTRAGSECAIIATRGKAKPASHSVRSVRTAKVGRHSEKPAEFRDDIIKFCGDLPRVELFASTKTEGWDVWGNEVSESILSVLRSSVMLSIYKMLLLLSGFLRKRNIDHDKDCDCKGIVGDCGKCDGACSK